MKGLVVQTTFKGIPLNSAFVKVNYLSGDMERIAYSLSVYASSEAYKEGISPLDIIQDERFYFKSSMDEDSKHMFSQIYEHVKTLEGYESATDTEIEVD